MAQPRPDSVEPAAFKALRDAFGDARLRRDEILAPYTTFKIGGPADLFFSAQTADELETAIRIAREHDIHFFLLGLGANILVGDAGYRGLVIRSGARHTKIDAAKHQLWTESGSVLFPDLIELAVEHGLSGLEHYVGIPSTIGGALWQNLHFLSPPPERERTMFIAEVLHSAELLTQEGERKTVGVDYFNFGYDYSILHDRKDVVLSATFQLAPDDKEHMRYVMEENLKWRRERHPPLDTEPSAGSIFQKIEGIGAGRLIDQCGLKGTRIGGAEITHRHANIMINRGGATASDVRALIAFVQETVQRETGYFLKPEISFVGEFNPPTETKPVKVPAEGVEG